MKTIAYNFIYALTCFIPFSTAWTFEGLETTFWSSVFPLSIANTGVSGDETGVSSDEFASNVLELEMLYKQKYKTN